MKLGIVNETRPDERRVAASPAVVGRWVKGGWEVVVERGAGANASYPDAQYEAVGAAIVDRQTAWHADIVLKLRPPALEIENGSPCSRWIRCRGSAAPRRWTRCRRWPTSPATAR
jgi:NAD/NADP transhydrogenase alpha subunit